MKQDTQPPLKNSPEWRRQQAIATYEAYGKPVPDKAKASKRIKTKYDQRPIK